MAAGLCARHAAARPPPLAARVGEPAGRNLWIADYFLACEALLRPAKSSLGASRMSKGACHALHSLLGGLHLGWSVAMLAVAEGHKHQAKANDEQPS